MRNSNFISFNIDFEKMGGPIVVLDPDFHSDPKFIKQINKYLQDSKALRSSLYKPTKDILSSYQAYSQEKKWIDLYKKADPFLIVRPDSGF